MVTIFKNSTFKLNNMSVTILVQISFRLSDYPTTAETVCDSVRQIKHG